MYLRADVLDDRLAGARSDVALRAPLAAGKPLVPLRLALPQLDHRRLRRPTPARRRARLRASRSSRGGSTARSAGPPGARTTSSTKAGRTTSSDHYAEQMREVEARGLREGYALTRHGQIVATRASSRAVAHAGRARELALLSATTATRARVSTDCRSSARRRAARARTRARRCAPTGTSSGAFAADGRLVFNSVAVTRADLRLQRSLSPPASGARPRAATSPTQAPHRRGARPGARREPRRQAASSSPRTIAGRRTLEIADLDADGALVNARAISSRARASSRRTRRASRPTASGSPTARGPRGGYRDIRLVDVATGKFTEITHDRALDWQPSFSPDGNLIFFSSDRSVHPQHLRLRSRHAKALAGHQRPHRRVLSRGVARRQDPRLRRLHSFGHDLYSMPLDRKTWQEAQPYVDTHPAPAPRIHCSCHHPASLQPAPVAPPAIVELRLRARIVRHRPLGNHFGE